MSVMRTMSRGDDRLAMSPRGPGGVSRIEDDTNGTKMQEAVAPVSFTASETLAKTGRSRCVVPAFLGFVPPTTWVPIIGSHG
ncbi:hypothetical protein jhhlp_002838 [Lomentospora prolificans]|uniref:Uncharacterized protein n=1 Tax=Lomentospora prolificans TaxID=41688 RepID=A0A2N3NFA8_9PEZI|nr:hypothetical protein jhhlp_002838 [Lomentospora prolificans]